MSHSSATAEAVTVASQALAAWISSLRQISPAFADFIRNITNSSDHTVVQKNSLALLDRGAALLSDYSVVSYTTFAATALGLFYCLFSMTSYPRRGYSPFGGRRSPYNASSGHGQIRESDFEYVEPDSHTSPSRSRQELRYAGDARRHYEDENAPDIIVLRHLNTNIPLLFKPYAISDGLVTVGDIRYFGSQELNNVDPRRLKLLYKRKELADDNRSAKDEGIKQQSEITVVISDALPQEPTLRNTSDDSDTTRRKKPKKLRDGPSASAPSVIGHNGPAASPPRAASPLESKTPRTKVDNLVTIYTTQWAPVCRQYLAHPPSDAKSRDLEHKRLTESILAQVVLKADEIDMQKDDGARKARRALLTEAQDMLKKLDAGVGKTG